jgi:hypothetical protein
MPCALLHIVLVLATLVPPSFCTCARGAMAVAHPGTVSGGCPCHNDGEDHDHDAAPSGNSAANSLNSGLPASPIPPPCRGHDAGCPALRAITDRDAGKWASSSDLVARTNDVGSWYSRLPAVGPPVSLPFCLPPGPSQPLYISLRTLLI